MRERCDPTQTQPSHPPPVLFCGVVIACWHLMVSIRCRNVTGQVPLSVRRKDLTLRERRHFPLSWSLRVVYHPVQLAVLATSQAIPRPRRRRCHKAVKNGVISSLCLFSLSPLCLLAEQNDGHVYYPSLQRGGKGNEFLSSAIFSQATAYSSRVWRYEMDWVGQKSSL